MPSRRVPPDPHQGRAARNAPAIDSPGAVSPDTAAATEMMPGNRRGWRVMGLRRRFLVDRRSQLRAGLLTSAVALVLLLLLNLSLYSVRSRQTAALAGDIPELDSLLRAQDRAEFSLVALASIVFLIAVFVVTILETHKTAGASVNLRQCLARIAAGDLDVQLRLRHGDNLRDLEAPFNAMSRSLQERAWDDADRLDQLAEVAERVSNPAEAADVAAHLRRLADEKRQQAG